MDPEQIYQEVLQEEQQKGSAPPVAEGRAKAARQRAVEGSPHPKEPKWWPGSQPHFEGGDGAAPAEAEAEEAEEEVVEEEPAAAPEPEPVAEAEPAPAPAAEPAPAEPAAAPTAAAAPAAVATAPEPAKPAGATHGTPSGNRLRPEDAVSTEAQFQGQRAMRERRQLIDELVSTGVPAVSADDAGRPRAPFLAILYVLIPVLAVVVLLSQDDEESAAEAPPPAEEPGGDGGGGVPIVAENIAFDTDTLTLVAGAENTISFENKDTVEHNVSIYPDADAGLAFENAIFEGEVFTGPATQEYTFEGPEAGEYHFQCDVHPNMNGAAIFE